jgi:hypothetical protein
MLVNKSSKKLHEDIKINSNNFTIKGEISSINQSTMYVYCVYPAMLIFFNENTPTGQKYFLTKIFAYIFHIKPLIFITFDWLIDWLIDV